MSRLWRSKLYPVEERRNFYSLWDKPFLNYLTHKDLNFESGLTQSSLYVKSQSSQSLAHLESQMLLGLQQRRTVCEAVWSLLFNLLQKDAARTHKMTTLLPPGPRKAKAMPNFSITWALTHSMCSLAEKTCISAAKQYPDALSLPWTQERAHRSKSLCCHPM